MIDKQLIQEMEYKDFSPIFKEILSLFDKLDVLEIRSIVGDRSMNLVEDSFAHLIVATIKALEL